MGRLLKPGEEVNNVQLFLPLMHDLYDIIFLIHFIAIICTVHRFQGRSYSDEESDEEEEAPAEGGEKKTQ